MAHYKHCLFAGILSVLLAASLNAKDIYRWVDENGTVHFQGVPPQQTKHPVTIKRLPEYTDDNRDRHGAAPDGKEKNPGSPAAPTGKEVPADPEAEIYVTSWCPHCKRALDYLRSQGIPFDAYDVEKDKNAARRKRQLTSEGGVPFALINGTAVQGFSPAAYDRALQATP